MWQPLAAPETELHRYLKLLAPFLSAALETQYASDPAKCLSLYMLPPPLNFISTCEIRPTSPRRQRYRKRGNNGQRAWV